MSSQQTTKERIVYASAELFRRQGYTGTGVRQIVEAAQAPFGSLYHHFPGGKEQLGEEVIRLAGGFYELLVTALIDPAPDIVTGIRQSFSLAGVHLADSDYLDACPIATIALEVSSTSEAMRVAAHEVFERWLAVLRDRLTAAGIDVATARTLALALLSMLEGAFVLARAARSTEPLDAAAIHAAALVRGSLPSA